MEIIGHRGARGLAPENTLASLQKAVDCHADYAEFDLRITKDGVIVLAHDAGFDDNTGSTRLIAATEFAELREHKADIATLDEVLQQFAGKIGLHIEIKPDVPTEPIVTALHEALPPKTRIASFSQEVLSQCKVAMPSMPLVINESWNIFNAKRRARILGTNMIAMNQRGLWFGTIETAHLAGIQLFAYTVNKPTQGNRWDKFGLAGVVTDYPDRFETKP